MPEDNEFEKEIREIANEEAKKHKDVTVNNFPDVQRVEVENWPEQKDPVVNVTIPPIKVPPPTVNIEKSEPPLIEIEAPDLSEIAQGLQSLSDKFTQLVEKQSPEIDYEKLEEIHRKWQPKITGHGGVSSKRVFLDTSGQAINPATSDNQTNGLQKTRITSPLTGFGELNTAENIAFIQAAPLYDLVPANFRTFTSGSGTAGVSNKMFQTTTGTSVGGYGAVQSFRSVNYKAGQAGEARFTALFESNVDSSWQGAGLLSIGDELSFGYNGTTFGIWHRYGGIAEVRTVTVTGAAGGSENLTLTLNGVGYTIPLTSGSVEHNAHEIASWLNNNQSVWVADQLDDTVIVSALSDGAKSGTYTFSSSTATGTIAQNTAGVTKTSNHIAQSDWNVNTFSSLDPSKGNVYQVQYQYLGFGDIQFSIEDPDTGRFETCHIIKYANANTTPSLGNPSLKLGIYCVSLGSTTNLTVQSGSMAAFVQGKIEKTRNPRAFANNQTLSTTNETNVLTIRNRRTYNGYFNQVEIEPLGMSLANETNKNVIVRIRASSDFGVEKNFTNVGTNLVSDVDITSTTVSSGRILANFIVAPNSQADKDLVDFAIRIPPGLNIAITAERTGGASGDVTASLTWYEDL